MDLLGSSTGSKYRGNAAIHTSPPLLIAKKKKKKKKIIGCDQQNSGMTEGNGSTVKIKTAHLPSNIFRRLGKRLNLMNCDGPKRRRTGTAREYELLGGTLTRRPTP